MTSPRAPRPTPDASADSGTGGGAPRCRGDAGRPFPFPVFADEPPIRGPVKRSRMGSRRALVLGGLHVAILAHAAHWIATGRTLSPVEPSESMRTLELGQVNAGFVFFGLAILSTVVFGRFVCGWGCHVVALQDLCAWIMKRFGVRPRPFRSRLLLWAPLFLALYMFVWPSFKREVLGPVLSRAWPAALAWIRPPAPFPGFTNHLLTQNFWETMPGWAVAVPFFLVCGFLTVWLMGAKAFCSYGCPYGGFFAPADRLAAGRIRVDASRCDGCGHCTVSCSSNVRVHEEVREYGMVVDPGCMKCLDCVSVCPTDALRFGFGPPAVRKPAPRTGRFRRVYDLPLADELLLAVAFGVSFFAYRGLWDTIPLLMAMGMAACTAFLAWLGRRLLLAETVTLQNLALKRNGRWRGAGVAAAIGAVATLAFLADAVVVQTSRARAEAWDRRVRVPVAEVLRDDRPALDPAVREAAERAAAHYRRADAVGQGGLAPAVTPEVVMRRAWLALVTDRLDEAERHLRRLVGAADGADAARLRVDLARVQRRRGREADAERTLRDAIAIDPSNLPAQRELALLREAAGDAEGALAAWVVVANLAPGDPAVRLRIADLLDGLGRSREAERYRR